LPRPDGVNCARKVALGAKTPWKRVRCARGGGTSAASLAMNCDLDDYAKWLSSRPSGGMRADGVVTIKSNANKDQPRNAQAQRKQEKQLKEALKKAEAELEKLQKDMQLVDAEVAAPGFYSSDKFKVLATNQRQAETRRQLDAAEARWMEAAEAVEALTR
jgi:ATP-binding cassette subfamily F protein 3